MKPDFITRLSQLAGELVAKQIISEYGGQAIYIRQSLIPGRSVRCGGCAHHRLEERGFGYSPTVSCGLTGKYTTLQNWRGCDKYESSTPELKNLAEHFGLSISEINSIAAGKKAA